MEEIKLIKPHHEGDSDLEVAVNGKKWKINIGETEKVLNSLQRKYEEV